MLLPMSFEDFLVTGVFAFMVVFVRFGTAIMIMPGIGDSYVSTNIRILVATAITFALFPVLIKYMPAEMPGTFGLLLLIMSEFIIGLFFGTIMRIFMTAVDVAGMVVSIQSGLGNAMVFNPQLAGQGSLIGAFLSVTAVVLLFATNLHHLLLMGMFESYELFPIGALPDSGSMADLIARAVEASFTIGVKMAAPFIIIGIMLYVMMGVLSRLMPQIQVFMIALPLQILIALITLSMVMFAMYRYWLGEFEQGMVYFLSNGGG